MNISPDAFNLLDDWRINPETEHKFTDFLVFEQSDLELFKSFTNKKYATVKSKQFWRWCFPLEEINELKNFGKGNFEFLLFRVIGECCRNRKSCEIRKEIRESILDAFEFGENQRIKKFHQLYTQFSIAHTNYLKLDLAKSHLERSFESISQIDLKQEETRFMEEN